MTADQRRENGQPFLSVHYRGVYRVIVAAGAVLVIGSDLVPEGFARTWVSAAGIVLIVFAVALLYRWSRFGGSRKAYERQRHQQELPKA